MDEYVSHQEVITILGIAERKMTRLKKRPDFPRYNRQGNKHAYLLKEILHFKATVDYSYKRECTIDHYAATDFKPEVKKQLEMAKRILSMRPIKADEDVRDYRKLIPDGWIPYRQHFLGDYFEE